MKLSFHGAARSVIVVRGEEKQVLSLGAAIQAGRPAIDVMIPYRESSYEV
jgi:metallo-beta-lactamase family protein